MVFLFTDQHVVEEGFLELINNMLTSGMVPALFADDEKENLISSVRDEAAKAGLPPTREALWQFFVSKCSNNLHVVMAMTPVGDLLSRRCRSFPGMVNNANIDWLFPWPDEALLDVASELIHPDDPLIPAKNRDAIIQHMVYVHKSVCELSEEFIKKLRRQNFVTPKNYLDFIATYQVCTESICQQLNGCC